MMRWEAYPAGAAIQEPGNSCAYATGSWRTTRPIVTMEKCTHCMICWAYCPDGSIMVDHERERFLGIDLTHCKGCGICAAECPPKAIDMVDEHRFKEMS